MITRTTRMLWALMSLAGAGCSDHHDDTHAAHPKLSWDEVALGCAIMGEGEAAHTMCNHGHSLNYRSESLHARWLYLRHHGIEPASHADLMMSGNHGHGVDLPEPLTPVLRATVGEKVRLRVVSYGPLFHTFHVHGHLWLDGTRLIDNRTLGPAEVHEAEFFAGASHDDATPRSGAGDWMYHCHVDVHAASGMWGLLRVLEPGDAAERPASDRPGADGRFPHEVPAPLGDGPGSTVDVWVAAVETPLAVTRSFMPATGELVVVERPTRLYLPVADEAALLALTPRAVRERLAEARETTGPWILSLRQGTRVRVHLRNLMTDAPVSLHPHAVVTDIGGDGTMPEATATPGGPVITYDWVADTAGTWPLHDHARTIENLGRGLFAALVVHPPGPGTVDRDYLVVMHDFDMDWFMGSAQPSGAGH